MLSPGLRTKNDRVSVGVRVRDSSVDDRVRVRARDTGKVSALGIK